MSENKVALELGRIVAEMEAEVKPLLNKSSYEDANGYDCCGCSTYEAIYDDMIAIVRRHLEAT